jgi:putative ABC transport system ATP-binding protein
VLEAESVSKSYRLGASLVTAIQDVSLSVASGELIALKGPSGSGKTTLLNLMGLLDRPDRGVVRVGGVEAEGLDENARSDLRRDQFGFVFQGFNLIPVLSAAENVSYPMALKGVGRQERRRRAIELLESVGIGHKHAVRPDLLSGGDRPRTRQWSPRGLRGRGHCQPRLAHRRRGAGTRAQAERVTGGGLSPGHP